eukprot:Gb_27423 [translate_table: standard]
MKEVSLKWPGRVNGEENSLGGRKKTVELRCRVSRGGPAQAAAGQEGSRGPARPRSDLRRMVGTQGETQGPTEARGRAPRRGKQRTVNGRPVAGHNEPGMSLPKGKICFVCRGSTAGDKRKNEDCLVLLVVSVPLEDGSVFKKNEKNPLWGEKQVFSPLYWFSSLRGGLGVFSCDHGLPRVSRDGSGRLARPCQAMQRLAEDGGHPGGDAGTYRGPGQGTKTWETANSERETRSRAQRTENELAKRADLFCMQGVNCKNEGDICFENQPVMKDLCSLSKMTMRMLLQLPHTKNSKENSSSTAATPKPQRKPQCSSPLFSKFWNVQVMWSPMPLLHAKLLHPPTSLKTSKPFKLKGLNGDQKRNKT